MKAMITRYVLAACLAAGIIFMQGPSALADQGAAQLRTWLQKNGASFRVVKLDRQDGFTYGMSISGRDMPTVIMAPGRNRDWLLHVGGEEMILGQGRAGTLQVIAQSDDDDLMMWICYFKRLTEFFSNILACTPPLPLCYTDRFLGLLIGLQTCVPVEPSYRR